MFLHQCDSIFQTQQQTDNVQAKYEQSFKLNKGKQNINNIS